jgi:hypothetical protein
VSDGGGGCSARYQPSAKGSSKPIGASWIMRDFLFWMFVCVGALAATGTFVMMGFFLVSVIKG